MGSNLSLRKAILANNFFIQFFYYYVYTIEYIEKFKFEQKLQMNIFVMQFYKNAFGVYNSLDRYLILHCANININYKIPHSYLRILLSTGDWTREISLIIIHSQYFSAEIVNLFIFKIKYIFIITVKILIPNRTYLEELF